MILRTPTGSGKSLVALALHWKTLCAGGLSYYTSPIKALANEKFFELCRVFGADNVGMQTGDASINSTAPVICCTAEILANVALRDPQAVVTSAALDEFHYYGDRERGTAWQIPLLTLPHTQFLLMSATLGDMSAIAHRLQQGTGRAVSQVLSASRPVPLRYEYLETPLHETLETLLAASHYPIYLVNFTQRAAAEQAQNLMSVNFCSKEEKEAIRDAVGDFRFDSPYGKDFQRFIRHGLGIHHAGLLPKYRRLVEQLAQRGLLKVVSGTDTLGVGINVPLRTVLFTQLCKFDGEKSAILKGRDFHQIAGRAGRKGFDDEGLVAAQAPEHVIENLRLTAKAAQGKKVVKKQPPQKGYVHWDRTTFDRLVAKEPESLTSTFRVTHAMLITLLQSSDQGYRRLVELILASHEGDREKLLQLKRARQLFRSLRQAEVVELSAPTPWTTRTARVHGELQRDFSLNQTLSLYLIEAVAALDPTAPTHALDVISLAESILENPDVVLHRQLDAVKDRKMQEWKAQGMEYEQRMEELTKLTWPKPLEDFIYPTFNAFTDKHPWVGTENVHPKSVAREILEGYASFDDYVRTYGLQRSEGVLLRYLTDAYKTLAQNVPSNARTDSFDDLLLQLRDLVSSVDGSLLEEWERLQNPQVAAETSQQARAEKPWYSDERKLRARVRTALHSLVRALSKGDYAVARALLVDPENHWTEAALAAEMEAFKASSGGSLPDITPRGRQPALTHFERIGPLHLKVSQTLIAADPHAARRLAESTQLVAATGAADRAEVIKVLNEAELEQSSAQWTLRCEVRLSQTLTESDPLLSLLHLTSSE